MFLASLVIKSCIFHYKLVQVTLEWRVIRLRKEERSPIWMIDANLLNKQPQTADKVWASSVGFRRGANN